ncbi:MAG: carboxypeptidase regulatory-like domain-containing protein [Acidobacteriota bacterium]|nr:carboxypeptidase regulatory-like domain-containing protein [Acidobacteriota bacterium]
MHIARTACLAGVLLLSVNSGSGSGAANGAIRGRVSAQSGPAAAVPRVTVADVGAPRQHLPVDRRSVVYLDPAPRAAFDVREEPRARMDQRKEMFVPHVLAIVAGTTVDFPNSDLTYHNVFSLSKTRSFDLGRYAVGRSKAVRFDRPGIVRVFCDIHSHMSAYILVFAHRYFAVTDQEGRYRIDAVPPGTYTVMTWSESAPMDSRRIVIPEAGGEVEHNVALARR